jgi:hypothetical protein
LRVQHGKPQEFDSSRAATEALGFQEQHCQTQGHLRNHRRWNSKSRPRSDRAAAHPNACESPPNEHGVDFKWQEGYGAFSVSPSQIQTVVNYIQNQETHHAKRSFEEEFVFLLKSSGLEYDPRYVFGQSSQINRPSGTSPSFFSASHPGLPSWAKFFGGLPGLSQPPAARWDALKRTPTTSPQRTRLG